MKVIYKKGGPAGPAEVDTGLFPVYGTVAVVEVTPAEMTHLAMAIGKDVDAAGLPDLQLAQQQNLVLVIDVRAGQVAHLLSGEVLPNLPALATATGETSEGLEQILEQIRQLGRLADVSVQGDQASRHVLLMVCKAQDNFILNLEADIKKEVQRLGADSPERRQFLSQARGFLNELEQARQKKKAQAATLKKDKAASDAKVAAKAEEKKMLQAMLAVRKGGPVNPDDLAAAWDYYFKGQ